ncbi:hypothetical protein HMPREF9136_1280 [Prevotella dentalis DSM 3688]|uniref:Uncharacterized protein n=1 Tax=Prevotella dentalis (strain ATCC 49559 / DSM 3688 / JCM 13448 / NCTC 12043 / ES 2772) TaxID=908937 RepID=F9D352_PREDD|nr:hypothetical protein HMPREF9136_1280 [Prevotella dentalis DSM 3688]
MFVQWFGIFRVNNLRNCRKISFFAADFEEYYSLTTFLKGYNHVRN